ncbi:MAG: phospholipid-binding protein MlaC [Alphaproteobacteria bacterium]
MRVKFFLRLIIFSLMFSPLAQANQEEITQKEAKIWAESKGQDLISTLAEPDMEKKYEKLDNLLVNDVDLEHLAKFVMGKYWRTMTPEQKEQYFPLFKRYSLALYKSFPIQFKREDVDFTITKVVTESLYANIYANVELKKGITGEGAQKQNFLVEFRVHRKNGKIMITDLKIAESSFLLAYRNRFTEMIARNDGDIEWFLEDLEDITKSIEINNEKMLNESLSIQPE